MALTSIEDIKKSAVFEAELPSFDGITPFVVNLRRPSLLVLCQAGKIPNRLLKAASSLFGNSSEEVAAQDEGMKQIYEVMDVICKASLVSPTYDELKGNGVELTDEQMIAIFNISQVGIKLLEPFRKQRKNT